MAMTWGKFKEKWSRYKGKVAWERLTEDAIGALAEAAECQWEYVQPSIPFVRGSPDPALPATEGLPVRSGDLTVPPDGAVRRPAPNAVGPTLFEEL